MIEFITMHIFWFILILFIWTIALFIQHYKLWEMEDDLAEREAHMVSTLLGEHVAMEQTLKEAHRLLKEAKYAQETCISQREAEANRAGS